MPIDSTSGLSTVDEVAEDHRVGGARAAAARSDESRRQAEAARGLEGSRRVPDEQRDAACPRTERQRVRGHDVENAVAVEVADDDAAPGGRVDGGGDRLRVRRRRGTRRHHVARGREGTVTVAEADEDVVRARVAEEHHVRNAVVVQIGRNALAVRTHGEVAVEAGEVLVERGRKGAVTVAGDEHHRSETEPVREHVSVLRSAGDHVEVAVVVEVAGQEAGDLDARVERLPGDEGARAVVAVQQDLDAARTKAGLDADQQVRRLVGVRIADGHVPRVGCDRIRGRALERPVAHTECDGHRAVGGAGRDDVEDAVAVEVRRLHALGAMAHLDLCRDRERAVAVAREVQQMRARRHRDQQVDRTVRVEVLGEQAQRRDPCVGGEFDQLDRCLERPVTVAEHGRDEALVPDARDAVGPGERQIELAVVVEVALGEAENLGAARRGEERCRQRLGERRTGPRRRIGADQRVEIGRVAERPVRIEGQPAEQRIAELDARAAGRRRRRRRCRARPARRRSASARGERCSRWRARPVRRCRDAASGSASARGWPWRSRSAPVWESRSAWASARRRSVRASPWASGPPSARASASA